MLPRYLAVLMVPVISTLSYTSGFAETQANLFDSNFYETSVVGDINIDDSPQQPPKGAFDGDNNFNLDPFSCRQSGIGAGEVEGCNRKYLFELAVSSRKTLGYNGARLQMFQYVDAQTDKSANKIVQSVYSDDVLVIRDSGIPGGNFNTEHTWPQSKLKKFPDFDSSRADLYHIFPVEIKINGQRGSLPFAECDSAAETTQGRVSQFCDNSFEPPEQQKGIIARAMFYISLSYKIPLDSSQEEILRIWNKKFPPTANEIERSNRIVKVQGNVNPFVGCPECANLISDF